MMRFVQMNIRLRSDCRVVTLHCGHLCWSSCKPQQ